MIGDLFLGVVFWFLTTVIGLLPSSNGFPTVVMTSAHTIGGYFGMLSPILPMGTLATVIALVFSVEIAIFGFKTLRWLIGHIPFIGGNH